MDIFDIRLANLQELVQLLHEAHPNALKKDHALKLDMSASYLSQLLGGKRMGEDVARKIEDSLELPHGWMDLPNEATSDQASRRRVGEPTASPYLSHAVRIDPDTIAAALKLVRLAFLNLQLEIDQEVNGTPLAYAYEYLLKRQERAVTPENVIDFSAWINRKLLERDSDEARTRKSGSPGGSDRQHG